MGIIELPKNDAILHKIEQNDGSGDGWSFQISVINNRSHVSLSFDLDHYSVCGDKILIPVKTNGYVVE